MESSAGHFSWRLLPLHYMSLQQLSPPASLASSPLINMQSILTTTHLVSLITDRLSPCVDSIRKSAPIARSEGAREGKRGDGVFVLNFPLNETYIPLNRWH